MQHTITVRRGTLTIRWVPSAAWPVTVLFKEQGANGATKLDIESRATNLLDALEEALRGSKLNHRLIGDYIHLTAWGEDIP